MIVTLDGRRLDGGFPPGGTLSSLVEDVRSRQLGERLVVSVAVNGHRFGEDDLESGLAQTLAADDQVDLESSGCCEVAAAALRQAADELAQSCRTQEQIAAALGGSGASGAVRQIGELVRTWSGCSKVVAQCSRLLGRNLAEQEVEGRRAGEILNELIKKLSALRDALAARDMVVLGDLMRYELPPLCQAWRGVLLSLAADIELQTSAPV